MLTHVSQGELAHRLKEAGEKVTVDALYTHFKDPTKLYKVKLFAILEETEEAAVVYEPQYMEGILFIRPLASWLDIVEWEGQSVPRFTKVESA